MLCCLRNLESRHIIIKIYLNRNCHASNECTKKYVNSKKQYEIDMWSMMQAEKYFCKPTTNPSLNFLYYIPRCPSFAVKYVLSYCRGKILTPPPSCMYCKRMGITYNVKL